MAKACVKVTQIVFAVSHHEQELGEQLLSAAGTINIPSSLVLTGSRYPQRNDRELKLALRSYEKKENADLGSLLILGPAGLAAFMTLLCIKNQYWTDMSPWAVLPSTSRK